MPPPAYAVVLSSLTTCAICLWVRVPKKMVGGRGGFSLRRLPEAEAIAAVPAAGSTKTAAFLPLLLLLLLRCLLFALVGGLGAAAELLPAAFAAWLDANEPALLLELLLLLLFGRTLRLVDLFFTSLNAHRSINIGHPPDKEEERDTHVSPPAPNTDVLLTRSPGGVPGQPTSVLEHIQKRLLRVVAFIPLALEVIV